MPLCAGALFALALPGTPLLAQSAPRLEDLIPDSAVEDPEAWARQGVPADAADEAPLADVDPDSPLAEAPPISVPWPDAIELPQLAPLEPDDSVQFAAIEDPGAPQPALADAEVFRLTRELVVAFPADIEQFPEREEFAARFEGLSTIADLGGSEDNIAQLAARAKADQELLSTLLRVYGYYDAQVIRSVGGIQPGEAQASAASQPEVRFDVIPGPRYRFGAIDLGELAAAADAAALRRAFEIETGDPLSSDAIVAEQADLDRMLGETGYAFAAIDAPELLVDHARTRRRPDLEGPSQRQVRLRRGALEPARISSRDATLRASRGSSPAKSTSAASRTTCAERSSRPGWSRR